MQMGAVHEILKAAISRAKPGDVQAHKDIYCELVSILSLIDRD
jgi:hypothetical protein